MEIFFKSSHEWIESCLKLSSHVRGGGFQSHREIYDFSRVCASFYFDSGRVESEPLFGILFAIVLLQILHVYWVETSQVLGVIYVLAEGWESISFVCRSSLTFGVDDVPCVVRISVMASRWTSMTALILYLGRG